MQWLVPLGISPCDPDIRRLLDRLHGLDSRPAEYDNLKAFWFVVDKEPGVPRGPNLTFLHAVTKSKENPRGTPPRETLEEAPGSTHAGDSVGPHIGTGESPLERIHEGGNETIHARDSYTMELARSGIPSPPGWLEDFRALFATGRAPSDSVLLFPGAGHPLKQWPMVQYFQLADMITEAGLRPIFALGPAELERGLVPEGREHISPASLEELQNVLLSARMAVGGDTGPMHLAGMLGVPGVSLFGPTRFSQWGPVDMTEVSLQLPCSPCTDTCSDLDCPDARCLSGITARQVFEALQLAGKQNKIGFQGPGIP